MVKRRQRKRSLARASAEARAVARTGAEASLPTSTRALALTIAEARARARSSRPFATTVFPLRPSLSAIASPLRPQLRRWRQLLCSSDPSNPLPRLLPRLLPSLLAHCWRSHRQRSHQQIMHRHRSHRQRSHRQSLRLRQRLFQRGIATKSSRWSTQLWGADPTTKMRPCPRLCST